MVVRRQVADLWRAAPLRAGSLAAEEEDPYRDCATRCLASYRIFISGVRRSLNQHAIMRMIYFLKLPTSLEALRRI
jgi:hypothetical protein